MRLHKIWNYYNEQERLMLKNTSIGLLGIFLVAVSLKGMDNNKIFNYVVCHHPKELIAILDSGGDVNSKYKIKTQGKVALYRSSDVRSEYTLLIYVVMAEEVEIVKVLLKYGVNIDEKDNLNRTVHHYAKGNPDIKKIIRDATNVRKLVRKNNMCKLYNVLSKEKIHDRYLLYYAMFFMQSKKQFEQFKAECIKNGIDLEKLLYASMPNTLLKLFLDKNIWYWNETMFKKFPTLKQKKDMMIYQFNDEFIGKNRDFDLKFIYR